jgi:leucyl-tRNA synthetase
MICRLFRPLTVLPCESWMTEPAPTEKISNHEVYDPHTIVGKWMKVWADRRTFEASGLARDEGDTRERAYVVSMFPYPSGDLHMGHAEVYSISDAIARYLRMRGRNVLNPIGWDSFGLPAENAALRRNLDPREWTYQNIAVQAESFRRLGVSFDWRTRLHTSDPEYYRWNQWLFLRLFERGLAFRKAAAVNWCPSDQTVLANEQVIGGRCERCGTEIVQRALTQWFFRTTAYAQALLDDMRHLEGAWPEEILTMQRNWIGRSEGAYIDFRVDGTAVRVFTTRPDTVFGATYMVLAPEHPLADHLVANGWPAGTDPRWTGGHATPAEAVEAYRHQAGMKSDIERLAEGRDKTGVFLGAYATNPVTGAQIPVFAADYVQVGYGTGAIMAVPGQDQRDWDFAEAFGLPIVRTVRPPDNWTGRAYTGPGRAINSNGSDAGITLDGLDVEAAKQRIIAWLAQSGTGAGAVTYRLRDWLLSRQRYWGTPIPIVHCPSCGEVAVPDDQLPVRLPENGYQLRPTGGRSPLESCEDWTRVACPRCGGDARRDTDTMDTFVDSSWYFLRYPAPDHDQGPFDPDGVVRWLPVDEYIGGKEHATGHLMYARFMTKALHDIGMVSFTEPFTRLTSQGQVIMAGKAMSKSLGNLVDLQEQIAAYGPDAVRVTMLFAGPPEDDVDWADVSPTGAVRWLTRIWRLAGDISASGRSAPAESGAPQLRSSVHRLIDQCTASMDSRRLNVAIARLMELTSVLRKAVDSGPGAADPAVREGATALVRMLSCVAPFTAEEAWQRLGNDASVCDYGWPSVDPTLIVQETVTSVIQVNGKVRDRAEVPVDIDEEALRELALSSARVQAAVGGRAITRVIVRVPKLVNVVSPGA